MQQVLRSHGTLKGLVFGGVGEVSKDVADLVRVMATYSAKAAGRALCARTSDAAVSLMTQQLRRTLAMGHWRDTAGLLLARLAHFEPQQERRGFGAGHGTRRGTWQHESAAHFGRRAQAGARREGAARHGARGTATGQTF